MKKKTFSQITLPKNAKIGIAAKNLKTNKTFFLNENKEFGTASVIKIAIALTLFKKAEEGKLDLYNVQKLRQDEIFDAGLGDCGILKYFEPKSGISLYNTCLLMLALSDNTATNLVLRFVKKEEVNALLKKYNFKNTKLTVDKLSLKLIQEPTNYVGTSTPKEFMAILEGIISHRFLSAKHSEAILQMMSLQQINHKIPRILPTVKSYTDKQAEIKGIDSKTGELSVAKISNDVATINTKDNQKIIMAIFTQNIVDKNKGLKTASIDHASAQFIAATAYSLYNNLKE